MVADTTIQTEPLIACTPNGVPPDKRERWEEVQELPDGYACRLPSDAATLIKAAEYVSLDRLCCTFVRWSLVIEPKGGPLWLHIAGVEGTKELTRHTFETTTLLREQVATAAGFSIASRSEPTSSMMSDIE